MASNNNNSGNKKSKLDQYLHRHYWSDGTVEKSYSSNDEEIETKVKNIFDEGLSSEKTDYSVSNTDGQELRKFRASLPSRGNFGKKSETLGKSGLSQTLGEDFGYRYVKDELGYEDILHPDEKSINQGYDHLCYDPGNGDLVVVEYKGQGSDKTKAQKRVDWTATTAEKIIKAEYPYNEVSEYEREFAQKMLEGLERGERVRYEVIRSYVDEKTGEFWTQLEESKFLEKEFNIDGAGETINAWDYLHPKRLENLDNKNEEVDEKSEEKVNLWELHYPEYVDNYDEAMEDELNDDKEESYDDKNEVEESSDEKVNLWELHYPEYVDDSDDEDDEGYELNNYSDEHYQDGEVDEQSEDDDEDYESVENDE